MGHLVGRPHPGRAIGAERGETGDVALFRALFHPTCRLVRMVCGGFNLSLIMVKQ